MTTMPDPFARSVFHAWAPPGAAWSPWVKPVTFASLDSAAAPAPGTAAATVRARPPVDVSWAPPAAGDTAVVVDLPGEAGVWAGLALAGLGYRPIPLYNAVPGPDARPPAAFLVPPEPLPGLPAASPAAVLAYARPSLDEVTALSLVDVGPTRAALVAAADALPALGLPATAPPAFLLDAHRGRSGTHAIAGRFDNRSVCLSGDFPTPALLVARGVRRVLVVRDGRAALAFDLSRTLLAWQEAGIALSEKRLDFPGIPVPLMVRRPGPLRRAAHQFWVALFLRPRPGDGAFGGYIPSGSGG